MKFRYLLLCGICAAGWRAQAADLVGVSMTCSTANTMLAGDAAGAPGVRQTNWNNASGTLNSANPVSLGAGTLMNQKGSVVPGLTVAITPNNFFSNRGSGSANDPRMFFDVIDKQRGATGNPALIQVSGIPYSKYNVYFYSYTGNTSNGSTNTQGGFVAITNKANSRVDIRYLKSQDNSYNTLPAVTSSGANYVLSSTAALAAQDSWANINPGNYVQIAGLTNSDFTALIGTFGGDKGFKDVLGKCVTNGSTTQRLKFSGFQIEEVPASNATNLYLASPLPSLLPGNPAPFQLTVLADCGDGVRGANVTSGAAYTSTAPSVFSVDAAGRVFGLAAGSANLVVSYQGLSLTQAVAVLAPAAVSVTAIPAAEYIDGVVGLASASAHLWAAFPGVATNVEVTGFSGAAFLDQGSPVAGLSAAGLITPKGVAGSMSAGGAYAGVTNVTPNVFTVKSTNDPVILVHRYSFRDPVGSTTITDSVGGANGTLFPPLGSNQPVTLDGEVANFPGDGDYTTAPYIALPPGLVGGLNDVTVELWAGLKSAVQANQRWFGAGSTPKGTNPHVFGGNAITALELGGVRGGNNLPFFNASLPGQGTIQEFGDGTLAKYMEHHLVAVYSPNTATMKYYIDGQLQAITAVSAKLNTLNDQVVWLGVSLSNADAPLNGWINELRIYEGAMNDAAVAANFAAGPNAGLPAPTLPLLTVDWTASPTSPPTGNGDVLSRLGVSVHGTSDYRSMDAAQAAGFKWLRKDLAWDQIETVTNVYNWSAFDGFLSALQSRGLKALFILDYGNTNYTGATNKMVPPTTTAAITAFGNFAYAAAQHFAGKGVMYEVWNEPDGTTFWPPTPNPSQYAALASVAIGRVHQGDPQATVLTGGIGSILATGYVNTFLSQGGGVGANGIGVHPYACTPPELLDDRLAAMAQVVSANFSSPPPLYSTEWGFTSTDFGPGGDGTDPNARRRQAIMVVRELLNSWAAALPLCVYYDVRDDGTNATDREHNFGLLANNYADKPAMTAVRTLTAAISGSTYMGRVPMPADGLYAMRFDGRTSQVFALWYTVLGGQVAVSVPPNATARDMLGNSLDLSTGSCLLSEAQGPVYLTLPLSLPAAPTGLNVTAGDGSCVLAWTASAGASSYTVKRAKASSGPYAIVATNIANLTYYDSGLSNGIAYYYVISAVNALGERQSAPILVRPVSFVPPGIALTMTAGVMQCQWPSDHVGWRLQSQTNSSATGLGTNWYDVSGATTTNQLVLTLTSSNCVFFRLVSP